MLKSLPYLSILYKRFVKDYHTHGLPAAFLNFFKLSDTEIEVKGINQGNKEVLEKKAVIIAANHPYSFEALILLASLLPRKDIFLITNVAFTGLVPPINKHLLPLYITHHPESPNLSFVDRIIAKYLLYHPNLPYETAHAENIKSIKQATGKLSDGGLVIIFPDRRSPDGRWYKGIGHLLLNLSLEKEVYFEKVYIWGTSNWDILRFFPKIGKVLPKIKVRFSPVEKFQRHKDDNPGKITGRLEDDFNRWKETIR